MKEILTYIILGWLLGLLSPPIISRIERYHKRKDLKITILSELKNLGVRLAAAYYNIQIHLGSRDKSKLRWVKSIYEKYRIDCPKRILEAIDKLLQAPDDQFDALASLLKAPENICIALKTYSLPFIESTLGHLSIFDSKFQRDILEIRAQITIFNEEVEIAMFYFRLTFDPSCMNTNKDIIKGNINSSYIEIQRRCKIIVDKIDKILDKD